MRKNDFVPFSFKTGKEGKREKKKERKEQERNTNLKEEKKGN